MQYDEKQKIVNVNEKKNQAELNFSFDLIFDKDAGRKQQFDLYRNELHDNS